MYKYCNQLRQPFREYLDDIYHIVKLFISVSFILVGFCHLTADYLVNMYGLVYHTDFNSQLINLQYILLSWIKVIGVGLIGQGFLLLMIKPKYFRLSCFKMDKKSLCILLINIGFLIALFHSSVNLNLFFELPAVILICFYIAFYIIHVILKLIILKLL